MIFIRKQAIVSKLVIATCALTGFELAALPAGAQISGPVNNATDETVQRHDGNVEDAMGSEGVFNNSAKVRVSDASLMLRSEGSEFTIEFSEVTRRKVVERLFAASGVVVKWTDTTHAEDLISGRYIGSREKIVNRLLSPTNFIVAYDLSAGEPRITSVVIVGTDISSSSEGTLQIASSSYLTQKQMALRDAELERARAVRSREQLRQRRVQARKLQKLRLRRGTAGGYLFPSPRDRELPVKPSALTLGFYRLAKASGAHNK